MSMRNISRKCVQKCSAPESRMIVPEISQLHLCVEAQVDVERSETNGDLVVLSSGRCDVSQMLHQKAFTMNG